jgi:hypothetical protein
MPYITLSELKVWLDEEDSTYDNHMLAAIAAAEAMVDQYLGRSLASATLTERVHGNGSRTLFPQRTPITAVSSCVVNGSAIDVGFDSISVWRKDGAWFDRSDEILLTYTAGFDVIPEDVKTATKITAQAIYSAADLDANMMSENIGGVVSGSYQPFGPGSLPPAARAILAPYRRVYIQ